MIKNALIIVDVQNDFMPDGALAVPQGDMIVPVINRLQNSNFFSAIVASQDWHPQDHMSFASRHPGKAAFEEIEWDGLRQVLWPDHCIQGSRGADFYPDLNTDKIEAIIRKGMDTNIDSYSAFFDNGHRKNTGLAGLLREKGITDLYLCGLAADVCVYYTAKDALTLGFRAHIIDDAVRPIDEGQYEKLKQEIISKSGKITTSQQLL